MRQCLGIALATVAQVALWSPKANAQGISLSALQDVLTESAHLASNPKLTNTFFAFGSIKKIAGVAVEAYTGELQRQATAISENQHVSGSTAYGQIAISKIGGYSAELAVSAASVGVMESGPLGLAAGAYGITQGPRAGNYIENHVNSSFERANVQRWRNSVEYKNQKNAQKTLSKNGQQQTDQSASTDRQSRVPPTKSVILAPSVNDSRSPLKPNVPNSALPQSADREALLAPTPRQNVTKNRDGGSAVPALDNSGGIRFGSTSALQQDGSRRIGGLVDTSTPEASRQLDVGGVRMGSISGRQPDGNVRIGGSDADNYQRPSASTGSMPSQPKSQKMAQYERPSSALNTSPDSPCIDYNAVGPSVCKGDQASKSPTNDASGGDFSGRWTTPDSTCQQAIFITPNEIVGLSGGGGSYGGASCRSTTVRPVQYPNRWRSTLVCSGIVSDSMDMDYNLSQLDANRLTMQICIKGACQPTQLTRCSGN